MAELTQIQPGVWSWTAPHPEWEAGDGWDPVVRCWALATSVGLVLVDPLVEDGAAGAETWRALETLAERHGPIAAVLRALHFHHRSASLVSARFDVPIYARPLPRDGLPVHPFDLPTHDGGELLGGLVTHHVARDDELVLEIPAVRALLFADVGMREGGRFELAPEHWVHPPDRWSVLRTQLRELADSVAPEHLLVSHGEELLGDGAELSAAVSRAAGRPLPPFVDAEDLAGRGAGTPVRLIDARLYLDGRSTREAFNAGHLPGAAFLDVEATLSDPPGPDARGGRHPLPSPERFAAGLAAAGISDGDRVVAYDDAGGVMAARLVWLLRVLGEDAALLSPVPALGETGPGAPVTPGVFTPRPWPEKRFASIEDVAARGPETVLLDARPAQRFAGTGPDPLEPRPGHIPGAVNLPAVANVDSLGGLLGLDVLRERMDAAGIEVGTDVISSCGSGVTACHNLLVLEALGVGPGRLYPGSFSEWSRDLGRPVVAGE